MVGLIISIIILPLFFKAFLVSGVKEFRLIFKLKKHGISARGQIVDSKEEVDLDNMKTYIPIVEFFDLEKTLPHRFMQKDSQMRKPIIGEQVNVKYDKNNPENAIIDKRITYNFVIVKLVIGILTILFLIFVIIHQISPFSFLR